MRICNNDTILVIKLHHIILLEICCLRLLWKYWKSILKVETWFGSLVAVSSFVNNSLFLWLQHLPLLITNCVFTSQLGFLFFYFCFVSVFFNISIFVNSKLCFCLCLLLAFALNSSVGHLNRLILTYKSTC